MEYIVINYHGKVMNEIEVLNRYSSPTGYEVEKGISQKSWEILDDYGEIKFYFNRKSDGSITFLIIFRAGITDHWCGWMPSDKQCKIMIESFPMIYRQVKYFNSIEREVKK